MTQSAFSSSFLASLLNYHRQLNSSKIIDSFLQQNDILLTEERDTNGWKTLNFLITPPESPKILSEIGLKIDGKQWNAIDVLIGQLKVSILFLSSSLHLIVTHIHDTFLFFRSWKHLPNFFRRLHKTNFFRSTNLNGYKPNLPNLQFQ